VACATTIGVPNSPWRNPMIPSPRPERPTESSPTSPPAPPDTSPSAPLRRGSPPLPRPPVTRRLFTRPRGDAAALRVHDAHRQRFGARERRPSARAAFSSPRSPRSPWVSRCCRTAPAYRVFVDVDARGADDRRRPAAHASSMTCAPSNSPPFTDSPSGRTLRRMRAPAAASRPRRLAVDDLRLPKPR